jgi:ubiquinone/menaquinone biosynthesis C-methylase UbiE
MSAQEVAGRGPATDRGGDPKQVARATWSLGDYHRFATSTVWDVGPVLVDACGIQAGQRVLDVATGSGNVAIRAAEAGAQVTASDLTPASFPAGRDEARARGVDLDWVEADAEALPFADEDFDVVTSCFGVMFAADHQAVADELLRVCRPGGTIGLVSFTPEGLAGAFFGLFVPYLPPPPPGAVTPLQWGNEAHVRELFGPQVQWRTMARRTYVETAATPRAYRDLFTRTFGPVIATYAGLADSPGQVAALDEALLDFATRADHGSAEGPSTYTYEYLLAVARKPARV